MTSDISPLVLVADDEPSMLTLVAQHLRTMGHRVLEASDGEQAWAFAREHLPDLVILDVMMPGMSGWEVCRKIREDVSLAHTGVVMLTGIGQNLNEMTSPLYGADEYIDKPFEFSELDAKVRSALYKSKHRVEAHPGLARTEPEEGERVSEAAETGTTPREAGESAEALDEEWQAPEPSRRRETAPPAARLHSERPPAHAEDERPVATDEIPPPPARQGAERRSAPVRKAPKRRATKASAGARKRSAKPKAVPQAKKRAAPAPARSTAARSQKKAGARVSSSKPNGAKGARKGAAPARAKQNGSSAARQKGPAPRSLKSGPAPAARGKGPAAQRGRTRSKAEPTRAARMSQPSKGAGRRGAGPKPGAGASKTTARSKVSGKRRA